MSKLSTDEIAQELNRSFAEEVEAATRYLHLRSAVRGLDRVVVEHVLKDAFHETIEHAENIAQKIRSLGHVPKLDICVSCPNKPLSGREALREALIFEEAALEVLVVDRGVRLDRTYQLNFGGNSDFLNMLERERLESKKISKTNAVTSMLPYQIGEDNVHVGPSDYVPWLTDRKWCHIRMEGTTFGEVPLNVETKLEVWDSPNSAGVMIDAVRCAKLALDRGIAGPLIGPSSYFMKTPPKQFKDEVAREMTERFISGQET